jgi:peptidoglycan hydrolase-like protein with peptidoglycan-binding domain
VVGYGYPGYAASGTVTPLPPDVRHPDLLLVDGVWGPMTTRGLHRMLDLPPTGSITPQTRTALQAWVAASPRDGVWGPITRKALQTVLGVRPVDGVWGPVTIKALQRRINAVLVARPS